jgi:hypothetical protein
MTKILLALACAYAFIGSVMLHAQAPSSFGTEFMIAIPPNDAQSYPVVALQIMIASPFDATVQIFDYERGSQRTRKVLAGTTLLLSNERGETSWAWEVWEPDVALPKGVRITSDQPIAVWVLNSKVVSSDGYIALPISQWGREYRVMSYYDFNEARPWAGGFLIVANEQTSVRIKLRGSDVGAETSGGRRIGDEYTVLLQEGDVYMVTGDATTRGGFDLSGTHITADRPIGVFGFHQRTTMPNLLIEGNGRNHLVEMLPPVSSYGTSFTTLELNRVRSNGLGSGDVFRLVSSEDNTRWSCTYYDARTGSLIGNQGGLLSRAGDVADISQTQQPTALVQGLGFWESDKPVTLMQYSCSSTFDGDSNLDPMMISISPDSTMTSKVTAVMAQSQQFQTHHLSVVVRTSRADPDYATNLASIRMNGSQLPVRHVTNDVHVATVMLQNNQTGSVVIQGAPSVSISGTVYGNSLVDAYGWAMAGGSPQKHTSAPDVETGHGGAKVLHDRRNQLLLITLEGSGITRTVQVFTVQGTCIATASATAESITLPTDLFAPGAYIIKVLDNTGASLTTAVVLH